MAKDGLTFDDSWMEETGGAECNTLGEYCDDMDVIAKHEAEADEAAKAAEALSPSIIVLAEEAAEPQPAMAFDDSWMEAGGVDCNALGEYRDDADVIAKHESEANQATAAPVSSAATASAAVTAGMEATAATAASIATTTSGSSSSPPTAPSGWRLRPAARADETFLVPLINRTYAAAEGAFWAAGDAFRRTNAADVAALVASGRLIVAEAAASADEGASAAAGNAARASGATGCSPGAIVGCVRFAPCADGGGGGGADGGGGVSGAAVTAAAATMAAEDVVDFGMLCVEPAWRLGGLGRALVEAVGDWGRAAGLRLLQCELLVAKDEAAHPHPGKVISAEGPVKIGLGKAWVDRTRRPLRPSL